MYVVTINSEIVQRFSNLKDCKDFLFCKHCFEEIPKEAMKVYDHLCNLIPLWNDEVVIV